MPPPFDYAWSMTGNKPNQTADAATGSLWFAINSWDEDDFDEIACCSVGIQLVPPAVGWLSVWSDPSLGTSWSDGAIFGSAHTEGAVGLWIGQYDQNANFEGAIVSQYIKLWDDDSHLSQSGEHQDSLPAYPLFAACPVDAQHQYIVSVAIFGRAATDYSAGGSAWANSAMNAWVPSIIWELK